MLLCVAQPHLVAILAVAAITHTPAYLTWSTTHAIWLTCSKLCPAEEFNFLRGGLSIQLREDDRAVASTYANRPSVAGFPRYVAYD